MNFYEEFSKLSEKDKKEVLDLMKFKRNLENEELKERIKKYEDPEDLTLMFMYCDIKAKYKIKELQERINKAIEYIKETTIGSILEVHCGEEEEYTEPLLEILRGEK